MPLYLGHRSQNHPWRRFFLCSRWKTPGEQWSEYVYHAIEPHTAQMVETEVKHRQAIEREKIGRFQQLVSHSSYCDNPVQAPFVALKWADGTPLVTDSSAADEQDRDKVIRAIAQTNMDLLMVRMRFQDSGAFEAWYSLM